MDRRLHTIPKPVPAAEEVVGATTRSARMAVKAVAVGSVPREKAADARKGKEAKRKMARGRMAVGLMCQEVPGRKGKVALVPRVKTAKTFSYKKQGLTLVTAPGLFI